MVSRARILIGVAGGLASAIALTMVWLHEPRECSDMLRVEFGLSSTEDGPPKLSGVALPSELPLPPTRGPQLEILTEHYSATCEITGPMDWHCSDSAPIAFSSVKDAIVGIVLLDAPSWINVRLASRRFEYANQRFVPTYKPSGHGCSVGGVVVDLDATAATRTGVEVNKLPDAG